MLSNTTHIGLVTLSVTIHVSFVTLSNSTHVSLVTLSDTTPHIQSNYCTYPYKRTATPSGYGHVLLSASVLNMLLASQGNLNENQQQLLLETYRGISNGYPQHMLL